MSQESTKKPLSIALGAAFATSLAAAPVANAADNPFAMSELSSGYMVADSHMEGKCGEGKCGAGKAGAMATEGTDKVMKEGQCGGAKMMKEGQCGGEKAGAMATEGTDKMMKEGKCGANKAGEMATEGAGKVMKEGKCGEGKCGANK